MNKIELLPLMTIPEVRPGDDLGRIISEAARTEIDSLQDKDIVIITMKIVSKAEGCLINLDKVSPSKRAKRMAGKTGKHNQLVQVILDHSEKIIGAIPFYKLIMKGILDLNDFSNKPEEALKLIRNDPILLITLDKRGEFYSDAGVDTSNHPEGVVSYPPSNPDLSARDIRQSIRNSTDKDIAVIIADTEMFFSGTIDMPRGFSGISPRSKRFAERDLFNRPKYGGVDLIAFELAAAASLLFGQTNEGVPVVIARGYKYEIMDEIYQRGNFSSAKKILKEILKDSIRFRISEYFDKLFRLLRKS